MGVGVRNLIAALGVAAALATGGARLHAQAASPDWAALQAETLRHFQAMLRLDTSNPPGNEYLVTDYLKSVLAAEGIPDGPAREVVAHPRFAAICTRLAERAREGFARAEREVGRYDAKALLPARVMMWGYRRLFQRLLARGWEYGARARPRLTLAEKLRMAVMAIGWRA